MLVDNWIPILGVPVIVGLALTAVRRAVKLRERIAQVREEQSRTSLPPFAQLAELMQESSTQESTRGKRTH